MDKKKLKAGDLISLDEMIVDELAKFKTNCFHMYGFLKSDDNVVGYFGKDLNITEDADDAMVFYREDENNTKGFARADKWLDFINSDSTLNHGYMFHLVPFSA